MFPGVFRGTRTYARSSIGRSNTANERRKPLGPPVGGGGWSARPEGSGKRLGKVSSTVAQARENAERLRSREK